MSTPPGHHPGSGARPGWRDGTAVVHAGLPEPAQGTPFRAGPTFASTYHLRGDPGETRLSYGRFDNPTWQQFEEAVAQLEGAPATVFSSGMAAVAAVMGTVLRPGDAVVVPSDGYYAARLLAEEYFASIGVQVRTAPTAGERQAEQLSGARLLWIESPSNPELDVCDIAALATAAREHGALVAVDNTTSTPLGQRPIALGADFSVASDTKALTGHSDLLLGHVAAVHASWGEKLRHWRTRMGAVAGPMEVWLAHRSLATLDVRLERMCSNALAIARFLSTHPRVLRVRYPGLPEDPSHPVALRQMSRFGCIVSFELRDLAAAENFFRDARLVAEATSFGGVHTMAERRARWGTDPVGEGFIRLSAGLEDISDLLDDLRSALASP
jgi:cystathionine gamma-lyase